MGTFLESLQIFRALLDTETSRKEKIIEIIKEECGVTLLEKNIHIKNSILSVTASPLVKSTLYTKKALLLERFKKDLPEYKNPIDIR